MRLFANNLLHLLCLHAAAVGAPFVVALFLGFQWCWMPCHAQGAHKGRPYGRESHAEREISNDQEDGKLIGAEKMDESQVRT